MDCCDTTPDAEARQPGSCAQCGHKGKKVDMITLKALLMPNALKRLESGPYQFCADPSCETVYFDGNGSVYARSDLTVPVWQKTDDPETFVCYCFEHSESSIRREIAATGATAAPDAIKQLTQSGRCACEVRNPQGTCCLGNVARVTKSINAAKVEVEKN